MSGTDGWLTAPYNPQNLTVQTDCLWHRINCVCNDFNMREVLVQTGGLWLRINQGPHTLQTGRLWRRIKCGPEGRRILHPEGSNQYCARRGLINTAPGGV